MAQKLRNAKWLKPLIITVLLLVVVNAGLFAILSSRVPKVDPQTLLEYVKFPEAAQVSQPYCIGIGGISDANIPIASYSSEALMKWSEVHIDHANIPHDQLKTTLSPEAPGFIEFCVPQGLPAGSHDVELILKDSASGEIAPYAWTVTAKP